MFESYRDSIIHDVWTMQPNLYVSWLERPEKRVNVGSSGSPFIHHLLIRPWYMWFIHTYMAFVSFGGIFGWFAGVFAWSVLEYVMYKYIFRAKMGAWVNSNLIRTLHFVTYGVHHKYPDDPLVSSIHPLISLSFFFAMSFIIPSYFLSGVMSGYVLYEITHFCIHTSYPDISSSWPFCTVFWKEIHDHHVRHHATRLEKCQNADNNFSVSFPSFPFCEQYFNS